MSVVFICAVCVCVCVCAGEPMLQVVDNSICHNATQSAVITGEVVGFPLATVYFYQLFDSGMRLVGKEGWCE